MIVYSISLEIFRIQNRYMFIDFFVPTFSIIRVIKYESNMEPYTNWPRVDFNKRAFH